MCLSCTQWRLKWYHSNKASYILNLYTRWWWEITCLHLPPIPKYSLIKQVVEMRHREELLSQERIKPPDDWLMYWQLSRVIILKAKFSPWRCMDNRIISQHFLLMAPDGCDWSASYPGHSTAKVWAPSTYCIGSWLGTSISLDVSLNGKITSPFWESNPYLPLDIKVTEVSFPTAAYKQRIWANLSKFFIVLDISVTFMYQFSVWANL